MKEDSNSSAFRRRLNVVSDWTARSDTRTAESSRRVRQSQETLGRQVLNHGSKGRPESALRQTEDDHVQTCRRSVVVSRQGMVAQCHVDTGVSEHRDGTWFSPGPEDCWLGHQTCKNRWPCNLYCVCADVKPCSINQPQITSTRDSRLLIP